MSDAIHLASDGNQEGPFTLDQVRQRVTSGAAQASTLCWHVGLAEWSPLGEVYPEFVAAGGPPAIQAPPVTPAMASGHVTMEVLKSEFYTLPKIVIDNAEVVIEAGAMHYMRGSIDIESKVPSVGGMFKAKLTGEKMVRPRYRGTGEIFLEPTFGEVTILELSNEHWVLDRGAFLAAEPSVEIGAYSNKAWTGFFGGEGLIQTAVSGYGQVMVHSAGPLERVDLNNDTLVVDGSFAVARTSDLEYGLEKATKGLFSSFTSGEGLVNTFRGTGSVLIAPVPNRFITLLQEFGGLKHLIRGISKN